MLICYCVDLKEDELESLEYMSLVIYFILCSFPYLILNWTLILSSHIKKSLSIS